MRVLCPSADGLDGLVRVGAGEGQVTHRSARSSIKEAYALRDTQRKQRDSSAKRKEEDKGDSSIQSNRTQRGSRVFTLLAYHELVFIIGV